MCYSEIRNTAGPPARYGPANVAVGRNWAGIHYRSDAKEGIALGVALLRDLTLRYREPCVRFAVRLSSGETVHVGADRA